MTHSVSPGTKLKMTQSQTTPGQNGSKHICSIFREQPWQTKLVADSLAAGIKQGEKGLLIGSHALITEVNGRLEKEIGDFRQAIANKQLEFMDEQKFYLSGGTFSLERVLSQIDQAYQQALADGFKGLRGIGEMNWVLKAWDAWESLFTYEVKLTELLKDKNLHVICLYDPTLFPAKHLYRAMLTHPYLATESYTGVSPTYVPAEQFLEEQWKKRFDNTSLNQTGKQFIVVEQKADQANPEEKPLTDQLLDQIKDYILLINSDGTIHYMNQSALHRFGNQVNRLCHESIFKGVRPCPICQLFQLAGEGKEKIETEIQDQKGAHLNLSGYPRADVQGAGGLIVYLRDVTQRRKWEEELAFMDKFSSLGYLSSGIAHELNNNLTPILICSQMLAQSQLPESVQQKAQKIETCATECKRLVDSLTDFAQKIPHRKDFADLNQIMQKTVDLMEYRLRTANVKVELKLDQSLPYLLVDELKIQQVFSNIITNAYQVMQGSGGKITITSTWRENWCRFEIADTGPGIPAEIRSKIFDPFFTTRQIGEGKGLGLSTAFGIISAHQGKISFETQFGVGTTFSVELPVQASLQEGLRKEVLAAPSITQPVG